MREPEKKFISHYHFHFNNCLFTPDYGEPASTLGYRLLVLVILPFYLSLVKENN